jgi:subtilisin-like proprotein convertase family protein
VVVGALLVIVVALAAGCSKSKTSPEGPVGGIVTSAASLQTTEGGPKASFTVQLATAPVDWVDVVVSTEDVTEGTVTTSSGATSGASSLTLRFTPTDWGTPRTVYVVPYNDTLVDGNVTYNLRLFVNPITTLDDTYPAVPAVYVAVTNADNDVPGFTVSRTTASTSEAGGSTGSTSFTVVLNTSPSAAVTVPVKSLDVTEGKVVVGTYTSCGSATESVSLVFQTYSWNTAQTVTICGQQDLVDDGNVTYTVAVGPPTGASEYAGLLPKTITVTNSDDDTAGMTVTAGATPLVTTESGGIATFTVRLNTQPATDVVVPVTSGNVAEGVLSGAGQNAQETLYLTFTPSNWSSIQTVTVTGQDEVSTPVQGDNVTYDVTLGPPTGDPVYAGSVGALTVSVTNLDNDTAALVLLPAAGSTLTVSETGVTTTTFAVRITKQPAGGASVVIPVTTSDVSEALVQAGGGIAGGSLDLTFGPADWQTPQTVTVVGQLDNTVDGTQTSIVTVGSPVSADAEYDALPASTLAVTTVDTDAAGFTVSRTSLSHTEGGAAVSFTVVLNKRPTQPVTIPVVSSNSAEGVVSGSSSGPWGATLTLTFTAADALTPQTVYVMGPADDVDDGSRSYTLTVGPTASSDARWALAAKTIAATNVDVDTAGLVVTPSSGLATTEGGGTATFTVRLSSKPTQTVTVPVSVPAASQGEVRLSAGGATTTTLYFTASDWSTPQTVTVYGQDDQILDGDVPFTLAVGATTSGDTGYAGRSASVGGQNLDDEVGHSEGTSLDPVNLDSLLPYVGTVDPGSVTTPAFSYYTLSRPAGPVTISLLAVTADVTLVVDDDGVFDAGNLCTTTVAAFASGSCSATLAAAGTIYIRVSTTGPGGAAFTIGDVVVQATWTSTAVPRAIPDAGSTSSTLTVSGGPSALSKVTVKLSITHTFDADLDIFLFAPDGTSVELSTDNGSSNDNYTNTVFDDAASTSITAGAAPFSSTYRPEGLLSALNGKNANGTWTLRVSDDAGVDVGTLTAWSITLQ